MSEKEIDPQCPNCCNNPPEGKNFRDDLFFGVFLFISICAMFVMVNIDKMIMAIREHFR